MKIGRRILLGGAGVPALVTGFCTAALGQEVRMVREEPRGIVLSLHTASPDLIPSSRQTGRVEPRIAGMPALADYDLPLLPYARALIGIPEGTQPSLRILSSGFTRFSDAHAVVRSEPAFGVTESDGWAEPPAPPLPAGAYPSRAAEISWVGWMRDAKVAEVRFYPVRSAGGKGGILHSPEIEVRVDFLPDPTPAPSRRGPAARGGSDGRDVWKALQRRTILNFDQVSSAETATVEGTETFDAEGTVSSGSVIQSVTAPLKISVKSDGLYRLDPNSLTSAGVDPNTVDPRDFRMEFRGQPIPIEVTGESDGVFNSADRVIFYGRAPTGYFTRTNVYWLHFDGSPSRVSQRSGAYGSPAPTPASFVTTVHFEQDLIYTQNTPPAAIDRWWGKLQSAGDPNGSPTAGDVTYTVSAPNVDPAAHNVTVKVNVQGRTATTTNPDHHTRIFLNGTQIDDKTWDGQIPFNHLVTVPSNLLVSGNNLVRVFLVGDTGSTVDQVYMNYVEITYQRTYAATSNAVVADGEGVGSFRFSMSGFATNDIMAYDATDPNGLVRITVPGGQITGSGPYTIGFQDSISSDRVFAASTTAGLKVPAGIVQDVPSNLKSAANGADYILVTPPEFVSALQPLITHRAGQGYRVLTAITDDIYDEFNFGIFEPTAIKSFLSFAYASYVPPAPEFVLLAGDGHVDYRDNTGGGTKEFVPPILVNLGGSFGEAPSDNEFVAVAGPDIFPEMFVGRFPARTPADITQMVDKIILNETAPQVGALNAQSLFVADNDTVDFEAILMQLASLLPPTMNANKIFLSQIGDPNVVRNDIRLGMDAGALVTAYMGHGSATQWTGECSWATSSVTPCFRNDQNALADTNRLTLLLAMNCINGYWVDDFAAFGAGHINFSLAEHMAKKETRGALAVWAPSALGSTSDYSSIGDWLFREIFLNGEDAVGRSTTMALISAVTQPLNPADMNNLRDLTLFGDPASLLALDSDGDGLLDRTEEAAGVDPLDSDSDDDGVIDGQESSFSADADGDGLVNALDPDSDNDGIFDGTEIGVTTASAGTDVGSGFFIPDADPNTTTDPLDADTDGGGVADGAEDRSFNGRLDAGETDATTGHGADDLDCTSALPELAGLTVSPSGVGDLALAWTGIQATHGCALYRIYVADTVKPPSSFSSFRLLALTGSPGYTHLGARTDVSNHHYLVLAFDPLTGEGPLGHYGR